MTQTVLKGYGGLIALALATSGCAAEIASESGEAVDAEGAQPPDVAVFEQDLINGTPVPNENYSGIVALQVFSTTLNDYLTICTGTLMANTLVITAGHCLWEVSDRTLYARMGSQRRTVTARVPHPTIDAAVLELDGGMLMWNWWLDHYTGAAQLNRTEYRRQTYRGTNASLNGKTVYCFGHGGANQTTNRQPPLEIGAFTASYPSRLTGIGGIKLVDIVGQNGVATEGGDSGCPCVDSFSMAGGQLAYIHSANGGAGVGAADFAYWADLVMYQLATTN